MVTATALFTGQCLCGGIQYQAANLEAHSMAHCHCSMCRKFHGAAYATYASVKAVHFQWLKGQELLKAYTASNGTVRQFCSHCGSSLTFAPANTDGSVVEIALGTVDTPVPYTVNTHIYCAYKANWSVIEHGSVQYAEGRSHNQS